MNKILFSLLAITSVSAASNTLQTIPDNSRNTLITAIARNDYNTTLKALEQMPIISQADKEEFLQIADQMIITAIAWYTKHHNHPEIGKDWVKAASYLIATVLSGTATTLSIGIVASILDGQYDSDLRNRVEKLQILKGSCACAGLLAILTGHLGYKTMQKAIDSWMKPSNRLENALRIKDAILQYEIQTSFKNANECVAPCCCPSETNFNCHCIGHICNETIEQIS